MIVHLLAAAIAIADTSAPCADSAARRVDPPWWEARVDAASESFTSRLTAWEHHTLAIQRRTRSGALGAEAFVARRFDRWEHGGAVTGAMTTWAGAYVDARVAAAPGALVIPRLDASADLYQSIGRGWEMAPGARVMRYADVDVPVYSLGLGRYAGDWYLRARASAAPQSGSIGTSGALVVRRYFGNATDLVEASAADGREVVTLAPGLTELRRSRSASLRGQRMLGATVGGSLALSIADEGGLPTRRGADVGVFVRW